MPYPYMYVRISSLDLYFDNKNKQLGLLSRTAPNLVRKLLDELHRRRDVFCRDVFGSFQFWCFAAAIFWDPLRTGAGHPAIVTPGTPSLGLMLGRLTWPTLSRRTADNVLNRETLFIKNENTKPVIHTIEVRGLTTSQREHVRV